MAREDAVIARRAMCLGVLLLREQTLTPDPTALAEVLCVGIRLRGLERLPWTGSARQLQARVALLRRREPEGWPDLSDEALIAKLRCGSRHISRVGGASTISVGSRSQRYLATG